MNNLAGFKKATGPIPSYVKTGTRNGKYDQLIQKVSNTGDTYSLDLKDRNKANSMCNIINRRVETLGILDVKAKVRGTIVYVVKEESDD